MEGLSAVPHLLRSYLNVFGKSLKKRDTGIKPKDCEDLPENWTGLVL